jgi:hypothetical protein
MQLQLHLRRLSLLQLLRKSSRPMHPRQLMRPLLPLQLQLVLSLPPRMMQLALLQTPLQPSNHSRPETSASLLWLEREPVLIRLLLFVSFALLFHPIAVQHSAKVLSPRVETSHHGP